MENSPPRPPLYVKLASISPLILFIVAVQVFGVLFMVLSPYFPR